MKTSSAFTMIEMVFVIVILGILVAVAIPRLAASRDDAIITKGKSQVSAIRSGISLQKSRNMLSGSIQCNNSYYPCTLAPDSNATLFYFTDGNSSNILEYPIYPERNKDGGWERTGTDTYTFWLMGSAVDFNYSNSTGSFNCNQNYINCQDLTR